MNKIIPSFFPRVPSLFRGIILENKTSLSCCINRLYKGEKMERRKEILKFCAMSFMAILFLFVLTRCEKKSESNIASLKKQTDVQPEKIEFSDEVKKILEKKKEAIENLAKEPPVIKFVKESNEKYRNTALTEILRLDAKWQKTEGIDDFIKSFMINDCGLYLADFQDAHEAFSEIFITNEKGLIVGETNKTSDFYQADEEWWVKAYDEAKGKSYYGELEYDQSSRSEAISLFVPVRDPETIKVIGVIKAVCDITAIKMEL